MFERVYALLKLRIGAEAVCVPPGIGRDERIGFVYQRFKLAACEEAVHKLLHYAVVQRGVFLALEYPVEHRARIHAAAGYGRIDGVVYHLRSVAAHEAAEGKVVVPRYHAQLAVLFIKVVIMYHGAGVAIEIVHKIMHDKIAYNLLNVYHVLDILVRVQLFQRCYKPCFVL